MGIGKCNHTMNEMKKKQKWKKIKCRSKKSEVQKEGGMNRIEKGC